METDDCKLFRGWRDDYLMMYEVVELSGKYLPEMIEINQLTHASSWHAEDFKCELNLGNNIKLGLIETQPPQTLTAFVLARLITVENPPVLSKDEPIQKHHDEIEILILATHPKHQRNGLAGKLLGKILDKLTNDTDIFLEVRKNNLSAISFYNQNGFEKVGRRHNYYFNPLEDALIMKLSIRDDQTGDT